jgi:UDP-N-acetylglucosamine 4,6-dehydratase
MRQPARLALQAESEVEAPMLNGKSILITGGTGSFGRRLARTVLERFSPRRVIVFSRDEFKQFEMQNLPEFQHRAIRFFLGDVRDRNRLAQACQDVDVVVHAAALKQVPAAEYNPFEAVKTNVLGAENIIDVSIERGVQRVIALSTDKACNPINLYGATKLCSDKLFVTGNSYASGRSTRFGVVRYGNVVGSRGGVIQHFIGQRETGTLHVTHTEMTRFWITLQQGADFVLDSLERLQGGELFVPKIPSMKVTDLARAIGPECQQKVVGIRPGEKLHEVMISEDDARQTLDMGSYYVVEPQFPWWSPDYEAYSGGRSVAENFRYSSDRNDRWLTPDELKEMIRPFLPGDG